MKEIIMALIVLFGGATLSISTFNDFRENSKLEKQGIEVMSEVLNEYTENTKNGKIQNYTISPAFKVQSGGSYTCHATVNEGVINQLKVNGIIKIRYLLIDPSICAVEGEEQRDGWFVMIIGIGIILGSIAYIYNRSSLPM